MDIETETDIELAIKESSELASQSLSIETTKNERNLMLYPFCSTSKALRFKSIRYTSIDKDFSLEVTANHEYGMVKIWDFDILRFVFSKIDTIASRTGYRPGSVSFSAYECLKFLRRDPKSGKNIQWLKSALDRLASTTYKGNIFRDETKYVTGFTLIKYDYIETAKGVEKISISLDERLVSSLRDSTSLVQINERVLEETSGLKKRLLELVALKTATSFEWIIATEELQRLCANAWSIAKFKNEVKSFVDLPWNIVETKNNDISFIKFTKK